ncbi:MAG: permease [Acidobacteria bacterium]|nr:permease [Acidobacteriota bacterium]
MARRGGVTGLMVLLVILAGLVSYKSAGAVRVWHNVRSTGTLAVRDDVVLLGLGDPLPVFWQVLNYLTVVWPALVFGILIASAVRAFVPAARLAELFDGAPVRSHVAAGLSGSPLMLCSCCVAPVFSAVYGRSSRLGPSLAVMLAAPALNPAALILTFALFSATIAWSRLLMGLAAVFLGTALVARFCGSRSAAAVGPVTSDTTNEPDAEPHPSDRWSIIALLLASCVHVTVRTVPLIIVGVVIGMLVSNYFPVAALTPSTTAVAIAVTAALAVLVALPTFFEIPLALTLLAAGLPAGAAAALLFAGPTVNLPSLLTVGRSAGWKPAVLVGLMVWLIALVGGAILG